MALTRQEADELLDVGTSAADDAAFVAALRSGRPEAFQRLVELHQTSLYNVALRIVQDREDARDIVQDVFVKALRALPSTTGRLHLRAWLYRVTINASYDYLRAAKRRPVPVEAVDTETVAPVDEITRAELSWLFARTLRTLPLRQQVALLLKDVHGLPHREIAEALDISRGSAEVLLFRARRGFRREFALLSGGEHLPGRCKLAEDEAARAVGSELSEKRRRRVIEHARTCPDCRKTVATWGGASVGLAIAFPLVAAAPGTAAAAGAAFASASGIAGAASAAGAAGGAVAGSGAVVAGASGVGAPASGVAAGLFAKVSALAGAKTAAVVVGACAVTAGSVAGVELMIGPEIDPDAGPRTAVADVRPPSTGMSGENAGGTSWNVAGPADPAADEGTHTDTGGDEREPGGAPVATVAVAVPEAADEALPVDGADAEPPWAVLSADDRYFMTPADGDHLWPGDESYVLAERVEGLAASNGLTLVEAWSLLSTAPAPDWLASDATGGDDADEGVGDDGAEDEGVGSRDEGAATDGQGSQGSTDANDGAAGDGEAAPEETPGDGDSAESDGSEPSGSGSAEPNGDPDAASAGDGGGAEADEPSDGPPAHSDPPGADPV